MARVREGVNAGRGATPVRQSPRPARQGRAEGLDPTVENGQTPPDIFGISQSYTTNAAGTKGQTSDSERDVTIMDGQLEELVSNLGPDVIANSGMPGSQGATNSPGGPDSVTYTDPWAILGGVTRDQQVGGHVNGIGDWTQANDMGYAAGPTLPGLTNARPTSSGMGQGTVRGANHPNARQSG